MAPIICHLLKLGFVEATAVPQIATFEAGVTFARTEGILSAPETNHAIRVTIAYLAGKLEDYAYPEEKVKEALASLPEVPAQ